MKKALIGTGVLILTLAAVWLIQPGKRTVFSESDIERFFPIAEKNNFSELVTESGVHMEVLYKAANTRGAVFVPGDTAPAWTYRPLANALFARGINVFSMNYLNYAKSRRMDPAKINNSVYVNNLADALVLIEKKYGTANPALIGHSRGGKVIQFFLENRRSAFTAVLLAPEFSSDVAQLSQDPGVIFRVLPNLIRKEFKFYRSYHEKRFFEPGVFSAETLRCAWDNSAAIPVSLIMDDKTVRYDEYAAPHRILVIAPEKDRALPYSYQKEGAERLQALPHFAATGISVMLQKAEGSHFSCIEHPDVHAEYIDGFLK